MHPNSDLFKINLACPASGHLAQHAIFVKIKRNTAFLKVLHCSCLRIVPIKLRSLARDLPLQKWWCGWWGLTKTSVRGVPYWWYTPLLIPRLPVRNEITWWSGAVELSHFGDCVSLRWTIKHCVFQIALRLWNLPSMTGICGFICKSNRKVSAKSELH